MTKIGQARIPAGQTDVFTSLVQLLKDFAQDV